MCVGGGESTTDFPKTHRCEPMARAWFRALYVSNIIGVANELRHGGLGHLSAGEFILRHEWIDLSLRLEGVGLRLRAVNIVQLHRVIDCVGIPD